MFNFFALIVSSRPIRYSMVRLTITDGDIEVRTEENAQDKQNVIPVLHTADFLK